MSQGWPRFWDCNAGDACCGAMAALVLSCEVGAECLLLGPCTGSIVDRGAGQSLLELAWMAQTGGSSQLCPWRSL